MNLNVSGAPPGHGGTILQSLVEEPFDSLLGDAEVFDGDRTRASRPRPTVGEKSGIGEGSCVGVR